MTDLPLAYLIDANESFVENSFIYVAAGIMALLFIGLFYMAFAGGKTRLKRTGILNEKGLIYGMLTLSLCVGIALLFIFNLITEETWWLLPLTIFGGIGAIIAVGFLKWGKEYEEEAREEFGLGKKK